MKKEFRNILASALAMVMLLTLAACSNGSDSGPSTTANEQKTIAVLLPGSTGYFVATRSGMDAAAEECGYKLEYADAKWDAATQLSQVEDYISKGVDMIALCAADADSITPAIKQANEAGIPIIAFINAIGDDPTGAYEGLVSYVGQSEIKTGELCAEIAETLLGDEGGKIVCLEGRPGTYPQRYRREGFLNIVEEDSAMEVVYTQTTNWEKEEAMKIVEDLIQSGTEFDLIFAQDDNSAIGAGKALEEAGLKDKVKVIGLGGSIDGLQALKGGTIDATTYMSAAEEGRLTIETIFNYFSGETVEDVTEIVQVEVSKENVDEFKGEW